MTLFSRSTLIKPAFFAIAILLAPRIAAANAVAPSTSLLAQSAPGPTLAAKKKKKKKKSKKQKSSGQAKGPKSDSFINRSNLKALVGMFLQDGSQLTFGGSYTMPFGGSLYADLGGDYTSWKTEILSVRLMRGAAGGGYAMSLSRSMLLRIGTRAGLAQISAEFPAYDEYGEITNVVNSRESNFYVELRSGLEIDFGGSLMASGEVQLPVFGGGDAINVSAMSIYGGLGIKF